MSDKKSYYAIIPAEVRYCKELTANAKLLYGELTALSNDKGFCWASNSYFAELYEVTPQAISKWINQLDKLGFVNLEYIRQGKEIKQRNIYINTYQQKDRGVSTNDCEGINKKLIGYQQKVKENNTVNTTINNKDNNIQLVIDSFNELHGTTRKLCASNQKFLQNIYKDLKILIGKEPTKDDFIAFFIKAKDKYNAMTENFHHFSTELSTISRNVEGIYDSKIKDIKKVIPKYGY